MPKKIFFSLLLFFLPTLLVAPLLRRAGYRIGLNTRVGFSILIVDRLSLGDHVRIGHLNFIRIRRLILRKSTNIGRSNIINGPLSLLLDKDASIGNRNKIVRATSPNVVDWGANVTLGEGTRVTADHLIDCTRSVRLGAYSILAGSGSQIWTHGYIHATHGPGRYRIDGAVNIGHNVYLGSRCIINLGVGVASASIVGAGAVVSKTLTKPGLYVAQGLRTLPLPPSPQNRESLFQVNSVNLCERVYQKRNDLPFIDD